MADHTQTKSTWFSVAGLAPVFIAAALFVFFFQALPSVAGNVPLRYTFEWVPILDIDLSFVIDGLSLTFALLITGIGALVMLYSARYLAGHAQQGRFSLYLTLFMLAMLGLVLSDNLLGMFVFWELTTVTSFLLIGFSHAGKNSRRAALQALLVTGTGALAMLAGIILIGTVAGTYKLSEIRQMGDVLRDSPMYLPILILILAGAFTKSAQIPFHFWLPNAMAAPTPVSAYLHSATMVKGGVYLLARMHPNLSGTDVWLWTLMIFGGLTAVFASVLAVRQTDLKQTLAYTTLMALGSLVLFLAAPGGYAVTAAATFLVVHSLYKASLFLVIGCVDFRTGTRDTRMLGGLARKMPITAFAAGFAALSMAGVPPFLGFIGKELLYKGSLESPGSVTFVTVAIFLASALMFAVGGIVGFRPFWGGADRLDPENSPSAEAPWQMLAGPVILASLGLFFGLSPHILQHYAITPTVAALLGDPSKAKELHLWAGVNTALYLSLATFALGFALYFLHGKLRDGLDEAADRLVNFDRMWDATLLGIQRIAVLHTDLLQSGVLKRYLVVVFSVLVAALAVPMFRNGLDLSNVSFPEFRIKYYVVFLLIVAGTLLTLITRSRIAAISGLGVVGIGVALIFIVYGAPDVAITQLLVEVLVVVLFAVAALRLPSLPKRAGSGFRPGDAILACSVGILITLLLLSVSSGDIDRRLTEFFEAASWTKAYGKNIVNVILVDFRALDTFGEIAVVGVAALSALALLRQGSKGDRS